MAYRWSLDGPGFEFPTPYTTENRFLRWRGCALLALAVVLIMVTALAGDSPADLPVLELENLPEPGSVWPHVAVALLMGAGWVPWACRRSAWRAGSDWQVHTTFCP